MGVPGFFAWLLKQDKRNRMLQNKLSTQPNCLYFDANCLFHPQCFKILKSFPFETNVNNLEQMMLQRIINYIDYLISYVNPSELVYIAVDGVAPLAKINQQRKRRYKSIEENKIKNDIYKRHSVPNNTNWSNIVITPGTEFMKKLDKKIKEYIKLLNIKNKNLKFIYSSYEERGEGEHKILQYMKNNYKEEKKTHVIYGLDADLIFLALASNLNLIYLLREQTQFGKKHGGDDKGKKDPITDVAEQLTYVSIDSSRLTFNTYFKSRLDKLEDEEMDFVDDFVFLCYFLGNDFIPHIPTISIRHDGIETLLDAYLYAFERSEEKLITVKNNQIKYSRTSFKLFLEFLADMEKTYFKEEKKTYRQYGAPSHLNSCDKELWELENLVNIKRKQDPFDLYSPFIELENAKSKYYLHYLNMRFNLNNQIKSVTKSFFIVLKWVGLYYFDEVPCWNLQYDYDAAPFISDISDNFEQFFEIEIEKSGKSFTIDQQLLSVIPPQAKHILNNSIQDKMEKMELIHMLPEKVTYDYEYKDKYWLCEAIMPYLNYEEIIEI
jgi:5'-3' exoribonuclease 2